MLRGKGREKQLVANTMRMEIGVIRCALSFPWLKDTSHEADRPFLNWVLPFNNDSYSCLNF